MVTAPAPDPWSACDWTARLHLPTSPKSDTPRLQGQGGIPNWLLHRLLNRMHGGVHCADETRRDEQHQPDDTEPRQRRTGESDHHKHEPQDHQTGDTTHEKMHFPRCGPFEVEGAGDSM